jgi:hypothetical protein
MAEEYGPNRTSDANYFSKLLPVVLPESGSIAARYTGCDVPPFSMLPMKP